MRRMVMVSLILGAALICKAAINPLEIVSESVSGYFSVDNTGAFEGKVSYGSVGECICSVTVDGVSLISEAEHGGELHWLPNVTGSYILKWMSGAMVMSKVLTASEGVTINPDSGTIIDGTSLTITMKSSLANAKIYYTTDGNMPNSDSSLYTGKFRISNPMTIRAFAVGDDGISCVSVVRYAMGYLENPGITQGCTFFHNGFEVKIGWDGCNGVLRYTTDGSSVTASSPIYAGPFKIDKTTVVKAKVFSDTHFDSEEVTQTFTRVMLKAAMPNIDADNDFVGNSEVQLRCSDSDAVIHYTLDGTTPNASSPIYGGTFLVYKTTTIKAIAIRDDYLDSEVSTLVIRQAKLNAPEIVAKTSFKGSGAQVVINKSLATSTVYYTNNGSQPTMESLRYNCPFMVDKTVTIRAIAVAEGYESSEIATFTVTKEWWIGDSLGMADQEFTTPALSGWVDVGGTMMRSGAVCDNAESILSTIIEGPAVITFEWRASCEDTGGDYEFDHGAFFVDGEVVSAIEGEGDWAEVSCVIGEGQHTLTWAYLKDDCEAKGEDCIWLRNVSAIPDGEKVVVRFDLNGDAGQIEGKNVSKGKAIGALPQVQRTGYDFVGWFTAPSGGTQVGADVVVNEDTTLYAHWDWIPTAGTVSGSDVGAARDLNVPANWVSQYLTGKYGVGKKEHFRQKFGDNLSAALVQSTTKANGAKMYVWEDYVAGTDPTDTNSVFTAKVRMEGGLPIIEWEPNLNENGEERVYTVFGKADLKDTWHSPTNGTDRFFKVSVAMPEGNVITLSLGGGSCDADPLVVSPGDPLGTLPEPTRDGYLFDGWYTSEEGGDKVTAQTIAVEGMTIYARWKIAGDGLVHRWSFNGNLNDSVASQTAVAVGSVTTGDRQCTLAGGGPGTSYIDLGDDILPAGSSGATIELWATRRGAQNFSRVIDIGSYYMNYLFWGWQSGDSLENDSCGVFALVGTNDRKSGVPFAQDKEYHLSIVIKPVSSYWEIIFVKRDCGTYEILSSVTISSNGKDWSPVSLGQTNCWLGHSQWSDNCDANASYNEVRIWNRALTDDELTKSAKAGPDKLAL